MLGTTHIIMAGCPYVGDLRPPFAATATLKLDALMSGIVETPLSATETPKLDVPTLGTS